MKVAGGVLEGWGGREELEVDTIKIHCVRMELSKNTLITNK